ncbi:hypothetical protein V8B97DRAFT_1943860 [Scleroderma yunnanense]
MNKLRKSKPAPSPYTQSLLAMKDDPSMSRTMQIALRDEQSLQTQGTSSPKTAVIYDRHSQDRSTTISWSIVPRGMIPRTPVAQYWAIRAAAAETVLSERVQHQNELMQVRLAEEEKRTKEIAAIVRANEARQSKLEKFVIILIAFLGYMLWRNPSPDTYDLTRKKGPATHFTIPILSPFTSVVENETGVFGTKSVVIFMLALAVLIFTLRRWFTWERRWHRS